MKHLPLLRRNNLAFALLLAVALSAIFASNALAAEVFQPRAWVGPYKEGKHSVSGLVDEIQGEGWQYESCVDIALEGGGYAAKHCAGPGHAEYSEPRNNGYARVWNAKGGNNEIWGWAYF